QQLPECGECAGEVFDAAPAQPVAQHGRAGRGNGAGLPGKTRRFHDAPTDPELYQNIVTAQRVLATRAVRGPGQAAEMARLPVVLKNDLLIKVLQRHGPEFYTIFR